MDWQIIYSSAYSTIWERGDGLVIAAHFEQAPTAKLGNHRVALPTYGEDLEEIIDDPENAKAIETLVLQ